ncbi:protein vreteno-like [Anopheles ziemanni]|uniref:protein vreteno-like n=1 Tax=Anopheles coustani TaxID=139045 RepID=UPI0026596156|nr:protein vreteno-like [Anopheles coustani]XP_058169515.1 protein vreteno-like [Anopheles ziemanni]
MEKDYNTDLEDFGNLDSLDVPFDEYKQQPELSTIVIRNVKLVSADGLRNLCRRYGNVVNSRKPHVEANIGFVEFANEGEALCAITNINSNVNRGFRAEIVLPKRKPSEKDGKVSVQLDNDEDWQQTSVLKRFNFSLMPPLAIKFPPRALLGTKNDYLSTVTGPLLRKVDPELFFSVQKVLPVECDKKSKLSGASERKEKEKKQKPLSGPGLYDAEKKVFTFSNLTEAQKAAVGPCLDCIVCEDFANATCSKCDNPYCSKRCHKQHHVNNVCPAKGQKPPVVPVKCDHFLKRDQLPTKANVCITAVLTQAIVFVRSMDPAVEFEYFTTFADCEMESLCDKTSNGTEVQVVAGEIYNAPGAPHGTYGRVLLIEPGPVESKCVFIEHGTISLVRNESLRCIEDPELKYRKVYVYKVCLADITEEFGEVDKAIQYLHQLKGKKLEMKYKMEAGNMVDIQLHTANFTSVNEYINRLIIVPPILTDKEHEVFIKYEDIAHKIPTMGKGKSIMILNRMTIKFDGRVTWIDWDDLPYLETLQGKLQSYGKKVSTFQRDFTPRLGELCLVRCMERWYRAVCQETAGDRKPSLFLCDYGCMVIVDLENIRKIPSQFTTEVRTYDGVVEGLLDAQTGGLTIDSDFLDNYLPENEPLMVDVSEMKRGDSINSGVEETYNVLNFHRFSAFTNSLKTKPVEDHINN